MEKDGIFFFSAETCSDGRKLLIPSLKKCLCPWKKPRCIPGAAAPHWTVLPLAPAGSRSSWHRCQIAAVWVLAQCFICNYICNVQFAAEKTNMFTENSDAVFFFLFLFPGFTEIFHKFRPADKWPLKAVLNRLQPACFSGRQLLPEQTLVTNRPCGVPAGLRGFRSGHWSHQPDVRQGSSDLAEWCLTEGWENGVTVSFPAINNFFQL